VLSDPWSVVVVIDASIKNQVTTLISYVYNHDRPVIKIVHHTVNIITTKAKLFMIRCKINQAIHLPNVSKILVITGSIHMARRIFDLTSHLYQAQSAAISGELREFFKRARREIELLGFLINCVVEQPLAITWTIPKIDGIVQVIASGCSTTQLIKKPRSSISLLSSHANHCGILARNVNMTLSSIIGRCLFKHQMPKHYLVKF